ncbi:hypothetical protein [Rhodospirillum rubrum]|uniref:Phasin domain-containing protein n=1 Tax=Rhodospirillum rubrum (strain ATCC 11170 / ATH 1.1.1 / DSM 467 / LMG 4362 / NCIMB 8255 / S1) TaxID=269796 RepID=Q2RU85_RHORT|nr:hypothetical protein [Rhodospirillum rubrum]ABC22310.1 hypothetical protein Rru_A1509 [Rhodospirillum rubrum ATCC 11170]AEO48029.1 hypothetical protein F11_07795 [Rhodospirillum rubrum F11]MBK5953878.1 hypothetical protein [Rhodospirillum rubrum]QXG81952.1 hypothetical protein KUL73_07820 [Rhodospirillum rubrum]HAQ00944.1 hypothetical protein [Rhodospirillum rubrum]
MLDPFTFWTRVMAASVSMAQTGLRGGETMEAAKNVIAARGEIMRTAMGAPLSADHGELARMVPEKVEAFSIAGAAMVNGWWAMQAAFLTQAQHVAAMTLRGRPPTMAEMMALSSRSVAYALTSFEDGGRLGKNALAPIHKKAIANAKRLKSL